MANLLGMKTFIVLAFLTTGWKRCPTMEREKVSYNTFGPRAQNNGWSTDNVWPRWPIARTNVRFSGHFDRTWNKWPRKKYILHCWVSRGQASFFLLMFVLVRLVRSTYYCLVYKILTGQKKGLTELKFLWSVNMIGNSSKFILSLGSGTSIQADAPLFILSVHRLTTDFYPTKNSDLVGNVSFPKINIVSDLFVYRAWKGLVESKVVYYVLVLHGSCILHGSQVVVAHGVSTIKVMCSNSVCNNSHD